jgi:DNA-binding NarL/FixJ family response regulator
MVGYQLEAGDDAPSQRDRAQVAELTAFECRVLQLFASGEPRAEIARVLNRAPKTISNSLTQAKDKLGARSLAEAAVLFAAEALVLAIRANA